MARKADHHARTQYCEHIGTMERSSLRPSHVRGTIEIVIKVFCEAYGVFAAAEVASSCYRKLVARGMSASRSRSMTL